MKKLIITAHPNPEGFTHKIAQRFREVSAERGHECYVMNLYDSERKQDYLVLDEHNKMIPDAKREKIQEKIMWADELVFVFPLRWFDAPAIMKNWFDMNITSGFAYRYKKGLSIFPYRYLKGKRARVFITAGAPGLILWTFGLIIFLTWYFTRIVYVGIRLVSWKPFGKVPIRRTPEEREKMLAKVARIARR